MTSQIGRRGFMRSALTACAAVALPIPNLRETVAAAVPVEIPLSLGTVQYFDFEAIRWPLLYGELLTYTDDATGIFEFTLDKAQICASRKDA